MERIFIGQESGHLEEKPVTKEELTNKIMMAQAEYNPAIKAKLKLDESIKEYNASIKNPPKRTDNFKKND